MRICTVKVMISPAEKTSGSLGLLAFPELTIQPFQRHGGRGGTYYHIKDSNTPHLATVNVGAVLGPGRSFRGHYSSHTSSQDRPRFSNVQLTEDPQGLSA